MKKVITAIFLMLVVAAGSQAQTQEGKGKISGVVVDGSTQAPVEFATVVLALPGSSKPVNGAVADEKGRFVITKVPNGTYQLIVSFIGYKDFTVSNITITDRKSTVETGAVKLSGDNKELEAVTVEGQRALIEEKVDRTVYNAENDATAKGGDATDVLKRVPLLTVDMDGNVTLRGNSNIRVLINNKPSTITASSVADALKQIPADQIKSVEVITSPSAKYDAEGSAGIINIITKKNTLQGLTLNIDGSAGYRGSNLGLNGNYRNKKMGFSLGGFGRANYNVDGKFSNSQTTYVRDDISGEVVSTSLNQQQADTRRNDIFSNMHFSWDYDINASNSLAASVRYGGRRGNSYQDDLLTQSFINSVLDTSTLRNVTTDNTGGNLDASLTYTHLFKKPQQEFSLLGQYSRNNGNNNFVNNILNISDQSVNSRLRNENQSYNEESTLQADYQTPISDNQLLEFGGKAIMRKVSSDYAYFESTGTGPYVPSTNSNLANVFTYNQNIAATYASYTYTTKSGYSFKGGARYEYTTISAHFANEKGPVVIPSYAVIVPSLNMSRRLKNGNTLKLSYNRRVQRPSIQYLNPNIQAANPYSITYGNPNLEPEYTNNYELAYSFPVKGVNLNLSTFVRNTDNAIQSVRTVRDAVPSNPDTVQTTYQNIGREDAYGGSIFGNVNISSKLMLNAGTDIYFAVLRNNVADPLYNASNEGWVANFRFFGNYTIAKGWGFQFFGFMRTPQVLLQGKQGNFYFYSLAFRKEFANKKGSVGIGAEQFLTPAMRIENTTHSPLIDQKSVSELYNMNFKVTFSYRIGKMSFDGPRRRKKSINNDDLKDGGGDGGGDSGGGGGQGGGGAAPAGGGARPAVVAPAAGAAANKPANTPPADPTAVVKPEGTWAYTVESPQGASGGTVTIRKEGDKFTGVIVSSRNNREVPLSSVTLNGNELTYTYDMSFGPNTTTIQVKSIITGDEMTGTMAFGSFGGAPLKAKRNP